MSAEATSMSARSATGRQSVPRFGRGAATGSRRAPGRARAGRLARRLRGDLGALPPPAARLLRAPRRPGACRGRRAAGAAARLPVACGAATCATSRCGAWLYKIARNCAIDLLRSRPPDHEQLDLEFDGVPQPPRLVEQKEEIGTLVSALRELPEGQRRALTLRELEGRSYSEISAELGPDRAARATADLPRSRDAALRPRRAGTGWLPAAPRRQPAAGRGGSPRSDGRQALERRRTRGGRRDGGRDDHLAGRHGRRRAGAGSGRRSSRRADGGLVAAARARAPRLRQGRVAKRAGGRRAAAAAAAADGTVLTGGAGVVVPDRTYSVAVPAAEHSSAGRDGICTRQRFVRCRPPGPSDAPERQLVARPRRPTRGGADTDRPERGDRAERPAAPRRAERRRTRGGRRRLTAKTAAASRSSS